MKRRIQNHPPVTQLQSLTVTIVRPQAEVMKLLNEPGTRAMLAMDLGKSFDKLKKVL